MFKRRFLQIGLVLIVVFSMTYIVNAQEKVIFDNGNIYGVANNPTALTKFTVTQPHVITLITNYHWNNGRGSKVGTIALKDSSGQIYGPWKASGSNGQGGVPNAYWTVQPNVKIPAGEFTVVDSDSPTWSQNSQSGGRGFSTVKGYLWKPATKRQLVATVENQSNQNVLIWQDPYEPKSPMDVLKYHLEPGWKTGLKVTVNADGTIKFIAGSGGASDTGQYNKVIGSCIWTDNPNDPNRIPYIVFDANKRLQCRDGRK